ncbi:U7 snRNA-associated Sm-like protein LSm11 [Dinothrombium tinctorium]|uniref:U7 snRNA-associated Sm-like protein LSm11 n=1 Tax=Dinothrombium tinctorium TaxID=1965070 RepID=A0A3S3P209_9ACAR|nr:U7 snRNA-associated Sm-like protein LSm11 [Dinothrombium tinctorium]RWS13102.1 U7 snRNA-associated Sm-like protein LSm11 [Dinothrombium tinctorium]
MSDENERKSHDSLNFESEQFDALKALHAEDQQLMIPVPNAKVFNNLDEYSRKSFGNASIAVHSSQSSLKRESFRRLFTAEQMATVSTKTWKEPPNVLSKMQQRIGPLSLLTKCLNKRTKVLIRRRRRTENESERFFWLTALLIAFDKHFNLVLYDVDEKCESKCDLTERHFNKLFVRGDNVVLVCLL